MNIKKISIINDGYVNCNSCFYFSRDILKNNLEYLFYTGINKLEGEIDSGVWAVSYLLSMYKPKSSQFILFKKVDITVNEITIPLKSFLQYSCYMDTSYPLFSSKHSIRKLVFKGLKKNNSPKTPEEIREIFHIDIQRFERPLSGVGNEIFKAMAAIGYSYNKQVFCFPWLSRKRFDSYHYHMMDLLDILKNLNMIVILPIGK